MAIAASGAVSFSDLRSEFVGGSSAISMSDLYRGGSNILSKAGDNPATNLAASVPTSGVIDIQDFYSTAKGFKNTISSSTTNVDADALFGDDYDINYPKIVDINSGVTVGGVSDDAIDIPSGLAGSLTINNAGTVIGFGGASAGATGGNAINCAVSGVTINNTGQISGGGGAGNVGGNGGGGQTSSTSDSGYIHNASSNWEIFSGGSNAGKSRVWFGGSLIVNNQAVGSQVTVSGKTYYRGSYVASYDEDSGEYRVRRVFTSTSNTNGGSGGSFGLGAGYNQTATNGGSGSSGGTNAGAGGAGSNGAALGTAAATSSAGANGNRTNGSAGSSGGAAGAAVSGTTVTMTNTGTLNGAVA